MSKAPNDKSPNSPSAQDDEPMSEARASAIERALEEGWDLLETGEDEAAIHKAEALVAKEPEVAEAIFLLASCQQSAGDTDAAVATLARAIELEPEWAEPELAAADWLAVDGQVEEALVHALAAVAKADEEDEFLEAIALKAGLEVDLDRIDDARKSLAVLPGPKTVEASAEVAGELGHLFLAVDEIDNARAWFIKATEIAPEDPDLFHGVGLAAELAGDDAAKTKAWLRTLELDAMIDERVEARMSEGEVAEVAEAALEELPPRARQLLAGIPILIADRPAQADVATGLDPRLMGLFSGAALPDVSALGAGPKLTEIILFRRNLERAIADDDELRDEIRTTLLHETGHFFGMTEEDLEEIGLG